LVCVVNQHVRPLWDGVATRLTLPQKPVVSVTVTLVCLSLPKGIERKPPPPIVKSPEDAPEHALASETAMITLWDNDPLDPVTITVYDPAGTTVPSAIVTVVDAFPPAERITLVRDSHVVGLFGETDEVRLIMPASPFRLVKVIVEVRVSP
jgi:hypothetical protein